MTADTDRWLAMSEHLRSMPEKELQRMVCDLLTVTGWRWCHFRPARKVDGSWVTALSGSPGFFDIVAMRRGRIAFIELKSERGLQTAEQLAWEREVALVRGVTLNVHVDPVWCFVWHPSDWLDGTIARILGPDRPGHR